MQECVAMQIVIITANLRLNYKQPETSNTACSLYFFSLPNQQGALTATTADGPEISPKAYILPWRSLQSSNPSHGPDHGAFSMSQPGEKIRSLDTHACCCSLEPKSQCFWISIAQVAARTSHLRSFFPPCQVAPFCSHRSWQLAECCDGVIETSAITYAHMYPHICTMYMRVSSTIKDIW